MGGRYSYGTMDSHNQKCAPGIVFPSRSRTLSYRSRERAACSQTIGPPAMRRARRPASPRALAVELHWHRKDGVREITPNPAVEVTGAAEAHAKGAALVDDPIADEEATPQHVPEGG